MLNHVTDGKLDVAKLEETVKTAVRMLDNVIDINFYPTDEARNSNMRHRPVGLGLMGFQDALAACGISYASDEAVEFADNSMEAISLLRHYRFEPVGPVSEVATLRTRVPSGIAVFSQSTR